MRDNGMPKSSFTLKYEGQALVDHEMDVALLAPALMGMQEIISKLVAVQTDGEYKASLKVKGSLKAGSIDIELITQAISNFQVVKDTIVDIFSNRDVVAGSVIVTLFTPLIGLILRHGKAKPTKVEKLENGKVKLTFSEETTIINNNLYQIYNSFEVREAVYKAVKPLEEEGVETLSIYDGTEKLVEIDEMEAHRFVPPSIKDEISVTEEVTYLQILKINFDMKNKWQFTQGESSISANIADEGFIEGITNRKTSFYDGDVLKVKLEKVQYLVRGKLKTDYTVTEVLEHIKPPRQESIQFKE